MINNASFARVPPFTCELAEKFFSIFSVFKVVMEKMTHKKAQRNFFGQRGFKDECRA